MSASLATADPPDLSFEDLSFEDLSLEDLSFDVEGSASQGFLSFLSDPVLLLATGIFLVALGLLVVVAGPGRRSPRAGGRRRFGIRRRRVPAQRLKLQEDRVTVK